MHQLQYKSFSYIFESIVGIFQLGTSTFSFIAGFTLCNLLSVLVNELYREGNVEQLLGGVLKPLQPKFVYIPDGLMVTPLKSTDNLMNKINEEIFKGLI